MDVLSEVLRSLSLTGSLLVRSRVGGRWGLALAAFDVPVFHIVASGRGWFEAARRTSLASLVASHPAPGPAGSGGAAGAGPAAPGGEGTAAPAAPAAVSWDRRGGIDDDEHLAAYNAFLARLNEAESGRKQ